MDRHTIRTKIRQQRASLAPHLCSDYSMDICQHLLKSWLIQRAQRIAFYFPAGNEVDLSPLIEFAWASNKQVYLPILGLRYTGQLWFVPFKPDDQLCNNRLGIPEPVHDKRQRKTKLRDLDIIFMPLVAFDNCGNRIGMGGGFYDKTLANLRVTSGWQRPKRIGIGYSLQQVDSIPTEKWDIPLHAIATEKGLTWF